MERMQQVVGRARAAFNSGRCRSLEFRIQQLKALKRMVQEKEEEIVAAIKADLHKSGPSAYSHEILYVMQDLILTIDKLPSWAAPRPVKRDLLTMRDEAYVSPEPLGVVLIMGPWNYPFLLVMHPLIGAIAAGNAVVMKPSEIAENTARVVADLLPQYLDPELYPVVTGGVPETTELLKQRFDHILYTGNSTVGKIVMAAAAKHLTPVTLELGGKSPCYIDKDCDLATACRRITWGKYLNCGQTCIAPDYILCDPSIQSKVVENIKATLQVSVEFLVQWELEARSQISSFHIPPLNFPTFFELTLHGGARPSCQPEEVNTMACWLRVPHAVLLSYTVWPLLGLCNILFVFFFCQLIERVISETSSGGVTANDVVMHFFLSTLPFGGVGNSGMGAYHGKHSFDTFSHHRACLIKDLKMEFMNKLRYPPGSQKKVDWAKFLLLKPFNKRQTGLVILALLGIVAAVVMKVSFG
ncbi:AL3A2 dehydrogenase, partial [Anhinga anhinga]|nr:AL3A2 dehydrogenase [Anhinga anhinga]